MGNLLITNRDQDSRSLDFSAIPRPEVARRCRSRPSAATQTLSCRSSSPSEPFDNRYTSHHASSRRRSTRGKNLRTDPPRRNVSGPAVRRQRADESLKVRNERVTARIMDEHLDSRCSTIFSSPASMSTAYATPVAPTARAIGRVSNPDPDPTSAMRSPGFSASPSTTRGTCMRATRSGPSSVFA